ncbi:MAG: KAP family NTPase [Deltaproteobacteria bacterium]|jgi:hypothetical protein|nr:KAP family NTPase [Deltaproteobacteria bacterium]
MTRLKSFNTSGICSPARHYMLPPLSRAPEAEGLIEAGRSFVIRAPWGYGKTTFLDALTDKINSEGRYWALHCDLSPLAGVADPRKAMIRISFQLDLALRLSEAEPLRGLAGSAESLRETAEPGGKLLAVLSAVCRGLDRELVLFFDGADCLEPVPLAVFLSRMRDGRVRKEAAPESAFPRSLAYAGLSDVRDVLARSHPAPSGLWMTGPFDKGHPTLALRPFTLDEVRLLFAQLAESEGQEFTEAAVERAWRWTRGHPWLVSALAGKAAAESLRYGGGSAVSAADMDRAALSVIRMEGGLLGELRLRLKEPALRRVMEAVICGAAGFPYGVKASDVLLARDLGLLTGPGADAPVIPPAVPADPAAPPAPDRPGAPAEAGAPCGPEGQASPEGGQAGREGQEAPAGAVFPANPVFLEIIVSGLSPAIPAEPSGPGGGEPSGGPGLSGVLKGFQAFWAASCGRFYSKNYVESLISISFARALSAAGEESGTGALGLGEARTGAIKAGLMCLTDGAMAFLVLFAFLRRELRCAEGALALEAGLGKLRAEASATVQGRAWPLAMTLKGALDPEAGVALLLESMSGSGAPEGWLAVFDQNPDRPMEEKMTWETRPIAGKTVHIVGC